MTNILKCKICGGDIELSNDKTLGTCMYCGSTMTFPRLVNGNRLDAFNRGNHFRRMGEFDNALTIYEQMIAEDNNDAEAHWCAALSRFGIEYVEDPVTMEYIPTCHRASYESFLDDVDYKAAVKYSEGVTQKQYQKDGKKIDEVQKAILSTSLKESPFDVFICYKESDESGGRTIDSVLAQDIYDHLTEKGYKTFFSKITLEDKVGTEFEPYIFAALNSAKVMIVVGTSRKNLDSVWVKNEWSRFLALMKKDKSKVLLPCYKDMDPYDMPEALSVLQSYNISSIGFMQDLIRGISKIVHSDTKHLVVENKNDIEPLLKRAGLFLETSDFERVSEYCEKVLDIDPENATAYLYKLMAALKLSKESDFDGNAQELDNIQDYQMAMRFADAQLKKRLQHYSEVACLNKAYKNACNLLECNDRSSLENALKILEEIRDWLDSTALIEKCNQKLEDLAATQKQQEEKKKESRKKLKKLSAFAIAALIVVLALIAFVHFIVPKIEISRKLKEAEILVQNGKYDEAITIYKSFEDYTEKEDKIKEAKYLKAEKLQSEGKLSEAFDIFFMLRDYKDSADKSAELEKEILTDEISKLVDENDYETAQKKLDSSIFLDETSKKSLQDIVSYSSGKYFLDQGSFDKALEAFLLCDGYEDSAEYIKKCGYEVASAYMKVGNLEKALEIIPYIDESNENKQYMKDICEQYSGISCKWKCKQASMEYRYSNGEVEKSNFDVDIDLRVKIDVEKKTIAFFIYPEQNDWFDVNEYTEEGTILHFVDSSYNSGTASRDYKFDYSSGKLSLVEKHRYDWASVEQVIEGTYSQDGT